MFFDGLCVASQEINYILKSIKIENSYFILQ